MCVWKNTNNISIHSIKKTRILTTKSDALNVQFYSCTKIKSFPHKRNRNVRLHESAAIFRNNDYQSIFQIKLYPCYLRTWENKQCNTSLIVLMKFTRFYMRHFRVSSFFFFLIHSSTAHFYRICFYCFVLYCCEIKSILKFVLCLNQKPL